MTTARPAAPDSPVRAPASRTAPALAALLGAIAGALAYGLVDAVGVLLGDTIPPTLGRGLLLALLDGLALAGLGGLAGLFALGLCMSPLGRFYRRPLDLGLLGGLALVFLLDLGEAWFKAPAPFTQAPPLHGQPLIFGAIALGVLVLALGLPALPMRRVSTIASALAATLLLAGQLGRGLSMAHEVPPGDQRPADGSKSVLLVTMDTARADYFGAYGRSDLRTPSFDGLARDGVRFDMAFSQIPVTGPSHATMMTGVAPWEHGNLLNGLPVDPAFPMLAQELRHKGWRTGAFVSAYVLDGELGFSRGFEVYDDDYGWLQGWNQTVPGRMVAAAGRFTNPDLVLERRGGRTVDAALAWMDRELQGEAPFFVWVHLFDAHGPYEPPPPWDTAYYQGDPRDPGHSSMQGAQHIAAYLVPSLRGITDADYVLAQYAGEVGYVDDQLGRLLDWLERSGRADDTLVIALGDHGESLAGEHGVWFNHGDDLYEPATWVPWAMRFPAGAHAGTVVEAPVELTDLAPTLYEVLGLPAPETITGQSLTGAIGGAAHRPFARGMALDRPINQELRASGQIEKPTFRLVALRTAGNRFVDHEHASASSEHWAITGEDPQRVEARAPISIPEENALEQISSGLLAGSNTERSQAEQSDDAIKKLQALGYMEE